MGTLRKVKNALRFDAELRPMLVRSTLHEVMIDLDGDKVADIALIDGTHNGDIDTIAIDVTGNGDFNIYISDTDGNGIPDAVQFYADGEDMPEAAYFGRVVEERMVEMALRIRGTIIAGEIITAELINILEEIDAEAQKEYAQAEGERTADAGDVTAESVEETAEG